MEWISVEESIPKTKSGKYKVRRSNGNDLDAFFYQDKIGWISFYGMKTSYWWDAQTRERLDDVTHWMRIPNNPMSL